MCGIVGLVNFNLSQPSRLILQKMAEAIRSRPDDSGLEQLVIAVWVIVV
jgi:asparagine synthetase B (glutamine-hydrolysing)